MRSRQADPSALQAHLVRVTETEAHQLVMVSVNPMRQYALLATLPSPT